MPNNTKQRRNGTLVGGITGKGFLRGQSGNPLGRPRTTGLLEALRAKMFEIEPDGRTVAQHVVEALVDESLRGRQRIAAASLILDRLEGRPRNSSTSTTSLVIWRVAPTKSCVSTCKILARPEQGKQYGPSHGASTEIETSTDTETK